LIIFTLLNITADEKVSTELKKQIIQARTAKKLTQAQLAQVSVCMRARYCCLPAAGLKACYRRVCASTRKHATAAVQQCQQGIRAGARAVAAHAEAMHLLIST
jgi:hypothetical protein